MNKTTVLIQKMCIAALLCAIGIIVPLISPVKIYIGPMSFTLASHIALFIAIFVSPAVAVFVAAGTTLGFLLAGTPLIVVIRAASHIVFVIIGALICAAYAKRVKTNRPDVEKQHKQLLDSVPGRFLFGLILSLIHAVCEVIVVLCFYFGGMELEGGLLGTVFGLVGLGTLVHSLIDYYLALFVWRAVSLVPGVSANFKYMHASSRT